MQIAIIGTGNTATVLGKLIRSAGHQVLQVAGRNEDHARRLAAELEAAHTISLKEVNPAADICIIAVADSAIPLVAAELRLGATLVAHTAGAVPAGALLPCSERYGVLYPLQSLRREMGSLPEMPLLVDAADRDSLDMLRSFAHTLSPRVQVAGDQQRLALHVAAVVVSNFTNHLYALAESWCQQEGVDFKLLLPLIMEVAGRLNSFSPREVQTGPAARGDMASIEKHLQLLGSFPGLQNIYKVLTESIIADKNTF